MPFIKFSKRWWGVGALTGGILLAVVTVFHPPLINPWAGQQALDEIAHAKYWMLEHAIMAVALTLWLVGLAGAEAFLEKGYALPRNATRLFIAALSMWMLTLALELGVIPQIIQVLQQSANPTLLTVGEVMYSFGIISGYFAMGMVWLAVSMLGLHLLQRKRFNYWPAIWGLSSGLAGVAGTALILWKPEAAILLLIITSLPAFLWTLWFCWKMCVGVYLDK